jgi:hypothetical protein
MAVTVTLTQVFIPSSVQNNPYNLCPSTEESWKEDSGICCYVKLSCSGGFISNMPIALILVAPNGGGDYLFNYMVDIPEGTNTCSLPVPYHVLKRVEGGTFKVYENEGHQPYEFAQGFEGIILLCEGSLPEYTYE